MITRLCVSIAFMDERMTWRICSGPRNCIKNPVNHAILCIEMGGPSFFLIMVQTIMSWNERSFRDIVEHMHRMKITYFT